MAFFKPLTMGGGPQSSTLTSSAGLGKAFCIIGHQLANITLQHGQDKIVKVGTYGDHFASDIANTASPALRWVVQDVVNANAAVLLDQSIKILAEQDILGGNVGKDQINFGLVASGTATDNGTDDLQHRGNAGTSGNHAEVANHVGRVDESTLGAADSDGLVHSQRSHELGDVALGVRLDQEIKITRLMVARDGRVRADNLLGGAIGLGKRSTNGDVLADRETKDGSGRREFEAVAMLSHLSQ